MPVPTEPTQPPGQAKAREAAAAAVSLAATGKGPFRPLAEQVISAAASVPANLVEGQGRSGRDRIYHWQVAYASARELSVHLELLAGAGAVPRPAVQHVRRSSTRCGPCCGG